jgi:hypothetical protein
MVKIEWNPNSKNLRNFAWTILIGFFLTGLLIFLKNPRIAYWTWGSAFIVGATALTGSKFALPFYWIWMGIAFVLGNIMSRILMFLIFACVLTPLSFLMRLIGRDKLIIRQENRHTYWQEIQPHKEPRESYERQF